MRRRLVIGYDGSSRGEDALALGAVLAGCLEADPLVVSATRRAGFGGEPDPRLDLPPAAEALGPLAPDQRIVVEGPPGRSLVEAATAADPVAAVVVGSTHRGRIGQAVLGGVGAGLLSEAACAVAVAPRGYARRRRPEVRRIGIAVRRSSRASPAVDAAFALAGRLGVPLMPIGAVATIRRDVREAVTLDPAAADVDLLFIDSRAHGQLRRALLGGVSGKLVGAPPCPILAFPRRGGPDPLGLLDSQSVTTHD